MQVLLTIDVTALSKGTQFCNELGYDVEPILMILVKGDAKDEIEPLYWVRDEISIRDLSPASEMGNPLGMLVQLRNYPVVIKTLL